MLQAILLCAFVSDWENVRRYLAFVPCKVSLFFENVSFLNICDAPFPLEMLCTLCYCACGFLKS